MNTKLAIVVGAVLLITTVVVFGTVVGRSIEYGSLAAVEAFIVAVSGGLTVAEELALVNRWIGRVLVVVSCYLSAVVAVDLCMYLFAALVVAMFGGMLVGRGVARSKGCPLLAERLD